MLDFISDGNPFLFILLFLGSSSYYQNKPKCSMIYYPALERKPESRIESLSDLRVLASRNRTQLELSFLHSIRASQILREDSL